MPTIPRVRRQLPSAEAIQPLRPEPIARPLDIPVDNSGARIAQATGETLVNLADVAQRFEADRLTTQASQASSLIQDRMIRFSADAKTKRGNDALGLEEYNKEFESAMSDIMGELGLKGTKVSDAVRVKLDGFNMRLKERLTEHQEKEQVSAAQTSIATGLEASRQQARLFPEDVDTIIQEHINSINAVRDIIGSDEAERLKKETEIAVREDMITFVALDDMEHAEELFSQYRSMLPKESIQTIEKEFSRIKKQNEADRKKAEEQAAEDWRGEFNKRLAEGNPMTILELESAPIPEKEKTSYIEKASKEPGKFEITEPVVYASISSAIDLNPSSLTQNDIWAKVGEGLSTSDAEKLSNRLKDSQKKGADTDFKTNRIKDAKKILGFARSDGKFDDDPQRNDLEWSRQLATLDAYMEQNPDADPIEFVEKSILPAEQGFIKSIVNFFSAGNDLPVVEDLTERNRAIEALLEVGAPITEANISAAHNQLTGVETNRVNNQNQGAVQLRQPGI